MLAEVLPRLMATIPVMVVVAVAVFALLHVTPGDPAVIIAGDYATPDDVARIHAKLGLDRPFLAQVGIEFGGGGLIADLTLASAAPRPYGLARARQMLRRHPTLILNVR
jgi:ABC-type dipeptide/oligopeptide/nickel transport system permease component